MDYIKSYNFLWYWMNLQCTDDSWNQKNGKKDDNIPIIWNIEIAIK